MDQQTVFEKLITFCHQNLLKDDDRMDYIINKRKLNINNIKKFQIGLFPNDLRQMFETVDPKDLRGLGIIKNASSCVFKTHNIVMPIRDVYGAYIALAGRTLLNDEERSKIKLPKYINSIYKKSHHLFGLNFAKKSIIKNNVAYVVEGYFDVITPQQHGFENIVATCGSFLSVRHIILLSRFTNNIVLVMDNEEVAQEKAKKIVEKIHLISI